MTDREPIRILPLGESTTQGSADFPGGYRGVLRELLHDADMTVDFVGSRTENSEGLENPEHEGRPGYRIEWLRTGLHATVLSSAPPIEATLDRFSPHIILLLMGTNNLYCDAPESAAAEMRLLLEAILLRSPDVVIVLGGITPILPGPKPWNCVVPEDVTIRVRKYNDALDVLARELAAGGRMVRFVNHHVCVESARDLHADGVHLKPAVMRRMAWRWFDELKSVCGNQVRFAACRPPCA